MNQSQPLVSIGIPTYNRALLLGRSIESALNQDFSNLEIIVSDNASTDDTARICAMYCDRDARVRYVRQAVNTGPTANFCDVLDRASGTFFMWLGDDDWIDPSYVSTCVRQLLGDRLLALTSGAPRYYRNGEPVSDGQIFSLLQASWSRRVLSYFCQVTDNGIFYGLMRTEDIRNIPLQNTMGGDWLLIASVVSIGKARMLPDVSVHREMGGATASYQQLAASLGLKPEQTRLPMLSIASSAWADIVRKGLAYKNRPALARIVVGCAAFCVIAMKPALFHLRRSLSI
jgi:glycosyltransferase involved in cell wall biosynthesis